MDTILLPFVHMFSFFSKFFAKKEKELHFQYDEKKYSLGMKVLIVLVTGVILLLSERALMDIGDGIPSIPYPEYEEIPEVKELRAFERETFWPLLEERSNLERSLGMRREDYDSRLLEKIAREPAPFYGTENEIKGSIEELSKRLESVEKKVTVAEEEYMRLQKKAEEGQKPVQRSFEWSVRWRQAKVFAWEALFWVPFFLFALFWHTRSKRKESRWEMVSLSVFIVAGIISLQSLCVLLWSWIPKELLDALWRILRATLFTRVIGYYVIIALVILVLGSLVVFIHRKITDPVRIGKRQLRFGLCPTCSYPLNLSGKFCGGCGRELKNKCKKCSGERYVWEVKCRNCGA